MHAELFVIGGRICINWTEVLCRRRVASPWLARQLQKAPSRTILLVEDEALVRDLASEVLRSAGHRVLVVSNATQAITALRSHANEVHLLLTDVVLPDQSGYDLARDITDALGHFTAVFSSGYPENSTLHRGLRRKG